MIYKVMHEWCGILETLLGTLLENM